MKVQPVSESSFCSLYSFEIFPLMKLGKLKGVKSNLSNKDPVKSRYAGEGLIPKIYGFFSLQFHYHLNNASANSNFSRGHAPISEIQPLVHIINERH